MRPVRLLAAATAGTVTVGLMTIGVPSAAAAAAIPAACPEGTAQATTIGSDDFDPNTEAQLPWTQEPADSWTATEAEDSYLHGSTPAEAGGEKSVGLLGGWLPADKTTVLVATHAYDFGDDSAEVHDQGIVEIGVGGTWTELASYSSTGSKATNEYDLTSWAGEQDVSLRFRIVGDGTPPETAEHGWSLYDVAIVRCDPAEAPSAPASVAATGGYGEATVKWQPPTSGTGPLEGYTLTVSPGDATYEVGPDVTSKKVSGLSNGTTYTFSVTARNATGTSPAASKKLVGTKIYSSAPKIIVYGSTARIFGKVARSDTSSGILSGHTVKLQARRVGTTNWSTITYGKTTTGGEYSFTRRPPRNYEYRVVYSSGNGGYLGSESAHRTINVRTKVSGAFSDSTPRVNQVVRYAGSVSPKHSWQFTYLQYYYQGRWETDPNFRMKLNADSKYSTYLEFFKPGTYYFRTYKPADDDHAAGYGPRRKVVVS